jgi:hypothetical protein
MLVAAALLAALVALVIVPTTAPAPAAQRVQGAIVVVTGNIDPKLLRQAGVTHVAMALTDDNLRDLATTCSCSSPAGSRTARSPLPSS